MNDNNKTLLWSVLVLISKISKGFSALLISVVIARYYGAEASGQYFLTLTIVLVISQISQLGFHQGALKFIPLYLANNSASRIPPFIVRIILISSVVSILCVLILFNYSSNISADVFNKPEIESLLKAVSLVVIGWSILRILVSCLQAEGNMKGVVIYENIALPMMLLAGVFLSGLVGDEIVTYSVITSCSYVSIALILLYVIYRYTRELVNDGNPQIGYTVSLSSLLKYSLPLMAAGLIQQLVMWSDTLMLGYFMSSEDVGVYNAGMRLALATTVVLYVVNTVLVPSISKACAQNEWESLKSQYGDVTYYLVLIGLVAMILMLNTGDYILLLFGDEFTSAATALSILMIGQFVNISTGSAGYILMMSGKERLEAVNIIVTLALNIIMNIYFISKFGINGAAAATSISLIVVNIARVYQNYSIVGLPWLDRKTLYLMLYTFSCFVVFYICDFELYLRALVAIMMAVSLLMLGIYLKKEQLLLLLNK